MLSPRRAGKGGEQLIATNVELGFGILGTLEVRSGTRLLAVGAAKQRALLAALLLHANQAVSSDRLIDLLWGDNQPDRAGTVLQVYVHHLRRLLEPSHAPRSPYHVLLSTPTGYCLRVGEGQLDLQNFEHLAVAGRAALRQGSLGRGASALRTALSLWRGGALADVVAPFAEAERARLEDRRVGVLEDRLEADVALGHHAEVISELETLAAEHSGRERFTALLIEVLYRLDRQSDALQAYERHKQNLVDEQGLDPSPALQTLYLDVLNQRLDSSPRPALSELAKHEDRAVTAANLPVQLTSFIGRKQEIADIERLLLNHRVFTLTGPAGVGKTRLALQIASELADAYRDEVAFVPLASITDVASVPAAVASALGVGQNADGPIWSAVIAALKQHEMLLVLDNVEHLPAIGPLLIELLQNARKISLMLTSRSAPDLQGAPEYVLRPLPTPDPQDVSDAARASTYDGVLLFVDRARAVRSGFSLTDANARVVADICARVDGLPLAIELAAAQVKYLPPATVAARLAQRLGNLDRGPPDGEQQRRTLSATVDWSYDLLDAAERMLFRRIAVFVGSWSLDATEAICTPFDGDIASSLGQLVSANLVHPEEGPTGEARFSLLQFIREYAVERLLERGESDSLGIRHADYYVHLASSLESRLRGPSQSEALERLQVDQGNMRAVLACGLVDPGLATRSQLVLSLWSFWETRGFLSEGFDQIEAILSSSERVDSSARAELLDAAGAFAWRLGNFDYARQRAEEGLAMARRLGETRTTAIILNTLGNIAWAQGRYKDARVSYQESYELRQPIGDLSGAAMCLNNLGTVASDLGEFDKARQYHEQSLAIRLQLDDEEDIAQSFHNLGEVALRVDDFDRARTLLRESLRRFHKLENKMFLADDLGAVARLAEASGDPSRAARWFAATAALRKKLKIAPALTDRDTYERSLRAVRAALGDERLRFEWALGEVTGLDDVIDDAINWSGPVRADRPRRIRSRAQRNLVAT